MTAFVDGEEVNAVKLQTRILDLIGKQSFLKVRRSTALAGGLMDSTVTAVATWPDGIYLQIGTGITYLGSGLVGLPPSSSIRVSFTVLFDAFTSASAHKREVTWLLNGSETSYHDAKVSAAFPTGGQGVISLSGSGIIDTPATPNPSTLQMACYQNCGATMPTVTPSTWTCELAASS